MTKKLLITLAVLSMMTNCKTVEIKDPQVRTHWIKKGEPAPFDGILLNEYTFLKLLEKAQRCQQQD